MYKIPLAKPDLTLADKRAVQEVLETDKLSLGSGLSQFEKEIAGFIGVKYAIAVNSGTSALHLIIRALGIKEGDEVITTPFSFISSSNCILYEKAKPVFVDIDENTLCINPDEIEGKITNKTKAILAVDVFGQPADWDKLRKIAKKHNLYLIEDSAEAMGSKYKGKKCGTFGDAAILSFYPNKQITTGEGGMILTNSKRIADLCRSMANQGRKTSAGKWLEHFRLGYNYRLDEMSCALGLSQLKRISAIIQKRKKATDLYNRYLKNIPQIATPFAGPKIKISRFVYVVLLARHLAGRKRNQIISEMAKKGIQCSNYFYPIHLQPFYKKEFNYKKGAFPVAEDIGARTLVLPFFNNLTEKEIKLVVASLKAVINKLK